MNGDFAQQLDAENRESPRMSGFGGLIPDGVDPLEFTINRVLTVIPEAMQGGTEPLSTIAGVLAQLYQAQALRDIAMAISQLSETVCSWDSSDRTAMDVVMFKGDE